jgi:hypothetical protein
MGVGAWLVSLLLASGSTELRHEPEDRVHHNGEWQHVFMVAGRRFRARRKPAGDRRHASPANAGSDAGRESTIESCRNSRFSRLDHPATDRIVICHARLHTHDLIGTLERTTGAGLQHVHLARSGIALGAVLSSVVELTKRAVDSALRADSKETVHSGWRMRLCARLRLATPLRRSR